MKFHNDGLQKAYVSAQKASEDMLKNLDRISNDIKNLEEFLQSSGFGEFHKSYKTEDNASFDICWNSKRLCNLGCPLIETKVKIRLIAYPFLTDFLESISRFHTLKGKE